MINSLISDALPIEYAKRLKDIGVDTSDAPLEWVKDKELLSTSPHKLEIAGTTEFGRGSFDIIPTYTFATLIEKLPRIVEHHSLIVDYYSCFIGYEKSDCGGLSWFKTEEFKKGIPNVVAVFKLLEWLYKKNYID